MRIYLSTTYLNIFQTTVLYTEKKCKARCFFRWISFLGGSERIEGAHMTERDWFLTGAPTPHPIGLCFFI